MKKKSLLILTIMLMALSDMAAQNMTTWEIKWNFYGVRHEGLMILAGNVGTFRVRCINRNNGNLLDIVDQYAIATQVYDGVVINCNNPVSQAGNGYAADNFKFFNNGNMYMMDNSGNWSTQVNIRQVNSLNELARMKRKYNL